MPGVAQRRTKLSGQWYDKGAAVPDELVTGRNVAMGLVVRSAESDETLATQLEETKAELAAALERAEAAEARVAELEEATTEPTAAGDPGAKAPKATKAKAGASTTTEER